MTRTATATKAAAASRLERARKAKPPKIKAGSAGLGARLRRTRVNKDLSVLALAGLAKVSHDAIRQIEAGRDAKAGTIEKLAAALGVEPGWLAFGEGK